MIQMCVFDYNVCVFVLLLLFIIAVKAVKDL